MNQFRNPPRSFNGERNENKRGFFSRLFSNQRFLAFLGLVLIILISFPLIRTYSQKKMVEEEMAELKADIAKYEQETAKLQEMITYLGSKESLEAQARLNLNLKKPNETVVVIDRGESELVVEKEKKEPDERSNLQKWWDYFFSFDL
ncbi:MAG: Septum formation initiator [Patescibacteria group bacterium]|nr:Septum formation initiator [Patescibacteria group bacterium]